MTLIITDLAKVGITMVADTALSSVVGEKVVGIQFDGVKLQRVPTLSAGISWWGRGKLPTPQGLMRTDKWLSDFISANRDASSIGEFAQRLARSLNELLPNPIATWSDWLGMHLAGYVRGEPKRPCLYHIRNVDGSEGAFQPYEFKALPEMFTLENIACGEHRIWRNGDFGPYSSLSYAVEAALSPMPKYGLDLRRMSLGQTVLYHSSWIRFVSDLYAAAGRERTIGGDPLKLAINPDGTYAESLTNCL